MTAELESLLEGHATVAAKIRTLAAAGYPRAEIARILGKRYQHVRNVLEDPRGVAEAGRGFKGAPMKRKLPAIADRGGGIFRLEVAEDGSIPLPDVVLQALELRPGAGVIGRLEGETFKLLGAAEIMREVRRMLPAWKPGEPLLSEELIADRRREAEAEDHGR